MDGAEKDKASGKEGGRISRRGAPASGGALRRRRMCAYAYGRRPLSELRKAAREGTHTALSPSSVWAGWLVRADDVLGHWTCAPTTASSRARAAQLSVYAAAPCARQLIPRRIATCAVGGGGA